MGGFDWKVTSQIPLYCCRLASSTPRNLMNSRMGIIEPRLRKGAAITLADRNKFDCAFQPLAECYLFLPIRPYKYV